MIKSTLLLFTLSPSLFWQGRSNSGSYINPGHGPTQPCAFPRGDYILCEWGRVVYSMMGTLHLCRVVERWKTFSSSSVFEGLTAQKSDFSFALHARCYISIEVYVVFETEMFGSQNKNAIYYQLSTVVAFYAEQEATGPASLKFQWICWMLKQKTGTACIYIGGKVL